MKILSLNVHAWLEEDPLAKLDQIVQRIHTEDYDLICMQEVSQSIDAPLSSHFMRQVAPHEVYNIPLKADNFALLIVNKLQDLGKNYYWSWAASHESYATYDEGLAILSKEIFKPQIQTLHPNIPYGGELARINLVGHFATFDLINCHYSWWNPGGLFDFKSEWQMTVSKNPQISDRPTIVAGDFNQEADLEDQGYHWITKCQPRLYDSYHLAQEVQGEATVLGSIAGWDQDQSDKRIDYVWVTPEFKVMNHRVIFDGVSSPIVSDHFGLEIDLNWEGSRGMG